MLPWLATLFGDALPGTGLFGSISFRAAGAAITAFLLTLLLGPRVIGHLRRFRKGASVKKGAIS